MIDMDGKLRAHARQFWKWWDRVQEAGKASPAGHVLSGMGFTIAHTGGGCLAWERTAGTNYVWITHEADTLGEDVEDVEAAIWDVGVYSADGDRFSMARPVTGLRAAIALAEKMLLDPAPYWYEDPADAAPPAA